MSSETSQLLSAITQDSEAIYSFDFTKNNYEENKEEEMAHFTSWRDDNTSKYKEIELICKNILEKFEKNKLLNICKTLYIYGKRIIVI
jgi:hypothetical protein